MAGPVEDDADLRKILLQTIAEESATARKLTAQQQAEQVAAAKGDGVEFVRLSVADRDLLINRAAPIYAKWGKEIGADYLKTVRNELKT